MAVRLLLIVLGGLALAYWRAGTIKLKGAPTGRKLERFTPFERSAHWANAIAFTMLAISGLVMAFGQYVLLPIIGQTLFGWLAYALKNVHNFAGPVFAVSLVVVIVTFVRDNLPAKGDLNWLLKGAACSPGTRSSRAVSMPAKKWCSGRACSCWAWWAWRRAWCSTS
jgi:formate dehydrogenase subunit gamma